MANIIIKSEERLAHERYVASTFGIPRGEKSARAEASAVVAARTREAVNEMRKMEEKKR